MGVKIIDPDIEKDRTHRRNVCLSVLNFVSLRTGQLLFNVDEPDEAERKKKAVDFSFHCGNQEYVLEHTLIESLPGQIQDGKQFMDLLGPLESELTGKLPLPGYYKLTVHFESKSQASCERTGSEP